MQLSKAMGEALYSLFGPNGQNVPVHTGEKKLLEAFKELERHGIVELRHTPHSDLWNVERRLGQIQTLKLHNRAWDMRHNQE